MEHNSFCAPLLRRSNRLRKNKKTWKKGKGEQNKKEEIAELHFFKRQKLLYGML